MSHFKNSVKPGDFVTDLKGSKFQNPQREAVAQNIIIISQEKKNAWFDFSFEEYQKLCKHPVTEVERIVLDALVEEGFLDLKGTKYSVNEKFIKILAEYIK